MAAEREYLPALRFRALTPLFDGVVRLTTRERRFKRRLVDAVAVRPGEAVLDIGCGTGTLALMLAEREPAAAVIGLDADPDILARARRKAPSLELVEAHSTALPFEDARFDAVVSSLFFHHLHTGDKRRTLAEVARVLRPDGRLLVADWGPPSDPLTAAGFLLVRTLDGFDVTADNARGALPAMFAQAGLVEARELDHLRTPLGSIALVAARKRAG